MVFWHTMALTMVVVCMLLGLVSSHGLMWNPPQRGATHGNNPYAPIPRYNPKASVDFWAHFPAGFKNGGRGGGLASQKQAAGKGGWTPYNPNLWNFQPRAGVCGDTLWGPHKNDHLRGGKYYNGGLIHKTFKQGSVISIDVAVTEHHNGYFAFWLCDVKKCGGEISWDCFKQGHCYRLQRAYDPKCENRYNRNCAPIDPKNRHRWYVPCRGQGWHNRKKVMYGGGHMLYQLPKGLTCQHCVLQWYWTSANSCNPPGTREFFTGPRSPFWGKCIGQGGAIGGWRRHSGLCGGWNFAEEYLQCADIRITPGWQQSPKPPAHKPPPNRIPGRNNPFLKIVIYGDQKPRWDVYNGDNVVFNAKPYKQITFVAVTKWQVYGVGFRFNGKNFWYARKRPYTFRGRRGNWLNSWPNPWYNTRFSLAVVAPKGRIQAHITLKR